MADIQAKAAMKLNWMRKPIACIVEVISVSPNIAYVNNDIYIFSTALYFNML
jgi:hypothetical protein